MKKFKFNNPLILGSCGRKIKKIEELKEMNIVMIIFTDCSVGGMSKEQYKEYFGGK